jgi:ABC-type proline/glycine betaine transport system permease subunit
VVACTAALGAFGVAAGVRVMRAVQAAPRTPSPLLLATTSALYLRLAVVVIAAILAAEDLGRCVWLNVAAGNVVGSAALSWYVVRTHPEVRTEYLLAGDDPSDGSGP